MGEKFNEQYTGSEQFTDSEISVYVDDLPSVFIYKGGKIKTKLEFRLTQEEIEEALDAHLKEEDKDKSA